jgi:methylase of polypeptide subunit release factors
MTTHAGTGLLRADLAAARFTVDRLTERWGAEAGDALFRGHRVPAERALRQRSDPDLVDTLAVLFVLGRPVDATALATALPSLGVAGAVRLGLVTVSEGIAAPLIDLRPYDFRDRHGEQNWWIASDLGELALGHALPPGHVLGVGGASNTLSGLLIDQNVGSALDLGTGCGIQAMHASRYADRVVATDISTRALELAQFNAELNGIHSIEFRHGNLFEPVAGERFDRIVSNPPFVITPRTPGVPAYEYRDGGMIGDALVAHVMTHAAEHLQPGGVAQLLGNWEYRSDTSGLERVAQWLDESAEPVDAWIVEREMLSCPQYAETWIRDGGTRPGSAEFDRLYDAWLDDFEARAVTGVGFGFVTLRAGSRPVPLRRLEHIDSHGSNPYGLGAHVAATLGALDRLEVDDDALLAAKPVVAGDVTEERHHWPGAADPTVIELRQGGGLGRTFPAGTALAALVGACDGELTAGAICAAIAELTGVDATALTAELIPQLRELVATGFLTLDS